MRITKKYIWTILSTAMIFSALYCPAQSEPEPETFIFNGNVIRFSKEPERRTYYLTDSRITDTRYKRIESEQHIAIMLNGEKIYSDSVVKLTTKNKKGFSEIIMDVLRAEISLLPDGDYTLDLAEVVINKKGKVAYYDTTYSCGIRPKKYGKKILSEIGKRIRGKMISELNGLEMIPPKYQGKNVPILILQPFITTTIVVNNNVVALF